MCRKVLAVLLFTLVLAANGWSQNTSRLKYYTTHGTSLTNEDIMRSFVNEVRTYLQQHDRYGCFYLVQFEVYQDSNKQNYAWATATWEHKFQWGIIYGINLHISNAIFAVQFCNTSFSNGSQSAREIITTASDTVGGRKIRQHILDTATSMFEESKMVLKMNNRDYPESSIDAFSNVFWILK